jgi:hypothetical protein
VRETAQHAQAALGRTLQAAKGGAALEGLRAEYFNVRGDGKSDKTALHKAVNSSQAGVGEVWRVARDVQCAKANEPIDETESGRETDAKAVQSEKPSIFLKAGMWAKF